MTDFAFASSKLGGVTAETREIAREVFEAAKAAGHDIWFMWGDGPTMDHVLNRQGKPVLDLMVRNEAAGDWIYAYVWQHRERLGLKHILWEQHITSTVVLPGQRRQMENRGSPTANHYDHVHFECFGGRYRPITSGGGTKSNEKIAAEVWKGLWGNGEDRRRRLTAAGYNYAAIQDLVNQGVGRAPGQGGGGKSIYQLAREVIRGDWGNGDERRRRLTEAGYNYQAVQDEVNRLV